MYGSTMINSPERPATLGIQPTIWAVLLTRSTSPSAWACESENGRTVKYGVGVGVGEADAATTADAEAEASAAEADAEAAEAAVADATAEAEAEAAAAEATAEATAADADASALDSGDGLGVGPADIEADGDAAADGEGDGDVTGVGAVPGMPIVNCPPASTTKWSDSSFPGPGVAMTLESGVMAVTAFWRIWRASVRGVEPQPADTAASDTRHAASRVFDFRRNTRFLHSERPATDPVSARDRAPPYGACQFSRRWPVATESRT